MKWTLASVAVLAISFANAFPAQHVSAIANVSVSTTGNVNSTSLPDLSNAILHPYYTCVMDMLLRPGPSTVDEIKVPCQHEVLTNPDLDAETKYQVEWVFNFSNVTTPAGAWISGVNRQLPPREEESTWRQSSLVAASSRSQSLSEENDPDEEETPFQKYAVKANQCQIAHYKCSGKRCEDTFQACMAEAEILGQVNETATARANSTTKRKDIEQMIEREVGQDDVETVQPLDPDVLDLESFHTYAEKYDARSQALLRCVEEDSTCPDDTQTCLDKFHQCQDSVHAEHDEQVEQQYNQYLSETIMEDRSNAKRSSLEQVNQQSHDARTLPLYERFAPMNRPDPAGRPLSLTREIRIEEAKCSAEYQRCLEPKLKDGQIISKKRKGVGLCGNALYKCQFEARGLPPPSPYFECGMKAAWGHVLMPKCKPFMTYSIGTYNERVYNCFRKMDTCGWVWSECVTLIDECFESYELHISPEYQDPWNRRPCTWADRETNWDTYTNDIGIGPPTWCPTNASSERLYTEDVKEKTGVMIINVDKRELADASKYPFTDCTSEQHPDDSISELNRIQDEFKELSAANDSISRLDRIQNEFKELFAEAESAEQDERQNDTLINSGSNATEKESKIGKFVLPRGKMDIDARNNDENTELPRDSSSNAEQNQPDALLPTAVETRSVSSPPYHDTGGDDSNFTFPCMVFCKFKRSLKSAICPILPRDDGWGTCAGVPVKHPPHWRGASMLCDDRLALSPSLLARRLMKRSIDEAVEVVELDNQNDLIIDRNTTAHRPHAKSESKVDHDASGPWKDCIIGLYCGPSKSPTNGTHVDQPEADLNSTEHHRGAPASHVAVKRDEMPSRSEDSLEGMEPSLKRASGLSTPESTKQGESSAVEDETHPRDDHIGAIESRNSTSETDISGNSEECLGDPWTNKIVWCKDEFGYYYVPYDRG